MLSFGILAFVGRSRASSKGEKTVFVRLQEGVE